MARVSPSDKSPATAAIAAVGALRLALEAAKDDPAFVAVAREILGECPATDPENAECVHVLIRAVQSVNAKFEVGDA